MSQDIHAPNLILPPQGSCGTCPMKGMSFELFMMLANVTSCLIGLDTSRPDGRVYKHLADDAIALMKVTGPVVGAAPEWYGESR